MLLCFSRWWWYATCIHHIYNTHFLLSWTFVFLFLSRMHEEFTCCCYCCRFSFPTMRMKKENEDKCCDAIALFEWKASCLHKKEIPVICKFLICINLEVRIDANWRRNWALLCDRRSTKRRRKERKVKIRANVEANVWPVTGYVFDLFYILFLFNMPRTFFVCCYGVLFVLVCIATDEHIAYSTHPILTW